MTVLSPACPAGRNAEESPCRVKLMSGCPDGVRIIHLSGVPGMRDSRRVHEVMAAALRDAPRAVVVDLSDVEHLDGDGVMLLILMRRQARRLGPTLPLAGATPEVARSLRRLDPNGLLHQHATVREAVRVNAVRVGPASMAACRAPGGPPPFAPHAVLPARDGVPASLGVAYLGDVTPRAARYGRDSAVEPHRAAVARIRGR